MNMLDIIILCCFAPAVIKGLSKGFLEQAAGLAGIVLSIWISFRFSSRLIPWIQPYLQVSDTVLKVAAFSITLIATALLTIIIARVLTSLVNMSILGVVDKLLGLVFALGTAALLIGVALVLFESLNIKFGLVNPETLEDSALFAPLKDFTAFVFPYLKQFFLKQ